MEENKKDQTVTTDNPTGQQNQDAKTRTEQTSQKPTTEIKDEQTEVEKEHQDKEHQHEYKAPIGYKMAQETTQDKSRTESKPLDTTKTPAPTTTENPNNNLGDK